MKPRFNNMQQLAPGRLSRFAQPGTVLVMVVALLGMLFVVGVAFLQTVTFEARQIESATEHRQMEVALETIETKVFEALNSGWLTPDGTPYRADTPELVTADGLNLTGPVYGELPYLHGMLSPLEPYLSHSGHSPRPVLPYAGNVKAALEGQPATLRNFFYVPDPEDPDVEVLPPVRINLDPDELSDFAVDADGDGVPDSREFNLVAYNSPIQLPPTTRQSLLERLNEPELSTNGIFLGIRAIPHGGMVDINWSHEELIYKIFPEKSGTVELPEALRLDGIGGPYLPQFEESSLRNRGSLPPCRLTLSLLHRDFEPELLGQFRVDPFDLDKSGTLTAHRWWKHNLSEVIDYPVWFETMNSPIDGSPNSFAGYDRRHNITTYSTDNLLMRDGTWDDPANANTNGRGWIEVMLEDKDQHADEALDFGRWALDDYPALPTQGDPSIYEPLPDNDPRKGRIQVSLPHLEKSLLQAVQGKTIDDLPEMRKSGSTDLERRSAMLFIRTIQDAFLLMLRNVDKGINNPVMSQGEIPRIAAALTANLIDFADSNEMPTRIEEIGLDGTPANHFHYGLERQPFITEVYTKVEVEPDGESGYRIIPHLSFSAVELYNPYNEDLHLVPVAPATVFTLRVNNGISDTDIALSGVIPARSFAVVVNNGSAASHGGVSGTSIADAALGLLQGGWTIQLIRGDGSPTSHTIVLDQFDIDSGSGFYGGTVSSAGTIEESQERAMWRMGPAGSGNPSSYWTAVVPLTQAQQNTHSLPGVNNWKGDYPGEMQMIRPVQVDFANAGNMLESFPTTGTLLLLMRYANTEVTPFNAKLTSEDADIWKRKQFQIDNGRMPVFDVAGKHRKAQTGSLELSNATDQNPLPMGYQFLPWGQYVFDYFTALPLDHRFGPAEDVEDPDAPTEPVNILPEVDLAGARVYGRINLNAAPWTVLSGLPLVPWEILPGSYKDTIHQFTYYPGYIGEPSRDLELFIGEALGKAIVAYRDARRIPGSPAGGEGETGSFQARDPHYSAISPSYDLCPPGGSAIEFGELRKGSGFLTVGELANVRHWEVELDDVQDGTEGTLWRIDGGVVGRRYSAGVFTNYPAEDYVQAVGLLVALGDWVTTRSNVWTIYGTLRGDRSAVRARIISDGGLSSPGELAAAGRVADERINKRAIRFQETVDRLPSFLKPGSPPRRIGERKVGAYNDMRSE